jgi:histidinol-phosphate phosphatase family protein
VGKHAAQFTWQRANRNGYHSKNMSADSPKFDGRRIRYVFLDRDGVINRKPPEGGYIAAWSQIEILPGVPEAIRRLNQSGRTVLVATNQRGIALGLYSEPELIALHARLREHLLTQGARLEGFYFCPHDVGQCRCRKPDPGMLEHALKEHPDANAANSLVIGDSLSDIEAGRRMGMATIFIEGEPDRQKPGADQARLLADWVAGSLLEAVTTAL